MRCGFPFRFAPNSCTSCVYICPLRGHVASIFSNWTTYHIRFFFFAVRWAVAASVRNPPDPQSRKNCRSTSTFGRGGSGVAITRTYVTSTDFVLPDVRPCSGFEQLVLSLFFCQFDIRSSSAISPTCFFVFGQTPRMGTHTHPPCYYYVLQPEINTAAPQTGQTLSYPPKTKQVSAKKKNGPSVRS